MAKKKIGHDDIFESKLLEKAIAEFTALLKITDQVEDNFNDILKAQQKALKTNSTNDLKGYQEQTKAIKAVADAEKGLIDVELKREKLTKLKQSTEIQARKELERRTKATNKAKKATFEEAVAIEKSKIKLRDYNNKVRETARLQLKGAKTTNTFSSAFKNFMFKTNFLANGMAMLSGIGIMGTIRGFTNLNKSLQETQKNITKTSIAFNVNRKEAKVLYKEVKAISDVYNEDYSSVLKSATVLTKEFGITNEKALFLINEGFEKGADVNGEYLELLKEYPVFLKEMGASAEETIAIITQTEQMGIFSDKGIDAIKEAGISIREMTKSTKDAIEGLGIDSVKLQKDIEKGNITMFEAVQLISKKLSELPESSAKVGTAIADIFRGAGEDAGLRYLKSLKDINIELSDVDSKLSESEISTNKLTKAWSGYTSEILGSEGQLTRFLDIIKNKTADLLEYFRFYSLENKSISERLEQNNEAIMKGNVNNRSLLKMQKQIVTELSQTYRSINEGELTGAEASQRIALYKTQLQKVNDEIKQRISVMKEEISVVLSSGKVTKEKTKLTESEIKAIEKAAAAEKKRAEAQKKYDDAWFNRAQKRALHQKDLNDANKKLANEANAIETAGDVGKVTRVNAIPDYSLEDDAKAKYEADAKAKREQSLKDMLQTTQVIADAINKVWQEQFDKKQALLDKEIEQSKSHQEELKELARKGVEDAADNLAFEQKKQAELEIQKAKQEKKLQQAQLAMEFIKVYASYAEDDPKTALTNTIKDIVVIKQAVKGLASLDKGIENTSDANQAYQANDGKGGFYAILHPNERVINNEDNKMLSGISNEKIAQLGKEYKEGGNWQTNDQILKKFDNLENAVKGIQKSDFEYNKWSNMITTIIKERNTKIKTHQKVGGLFSN